MAFFLSQREREMKTVNPRIAKSGGDIIQQTLCRGQFQWWLGPGRPYGFPRLPVSQRQHRCKAVIEKIKNLPVGGGLPNVLVY